jgi:hypothetical protein
MGKEKYPMADIGTSIDTTIDTLSGSPYKTVQTYEQRVEHADLNALIDAREKINKINKRNARTSMFDKCKFASKS